MRLFLTSVAAALAFSSSLAMAEPVKVVASFSILGDMVQQIGGSDVVVTTLVGPDGDAHVFEPSPLDAQAVAGADLVIVNGLGFEGWLPRLLEAAEFKGLVIEAAQNVAPLAWEEEHHEEGEEAHSEEEHTEEAHAEEEHAEEHHNHGSFDPHAWQNLENGALYAEAIAQALATVDPAHGADYLARGAAYAAEIRSLHASVIERFAALPESARNVVTTHDAFGYFEAAYGVHFLAPVGVSTESEASAEDVAALIRQIREEGVTALFVETISDPRLIEQIDAETDATFGGALYSDALSRADGPAATYLDLFRYNVETLLAAMTGA